MFTTEEKSFLEIRLWKNENSIKFDILSKLSSEEKASDGVVIDAWWKDKFERRLRVGLIMIP